MIQLVLFERGVMKLAAMIALLLARIGLGVWIDKSILRGAQPQGNGLGARSLIYTRPIHNRLKMVRARFLAALTKPLIVLSMTLPFLGFMLRERYGDWSLLGLLGGLLIFILAAYCGRYWYDLHPDYKTLQQGLEQPNTREVEHDSGKLEPQRGGRTDIRHRPDRRSASGGVVDESGPAQAEAV